MKTRFSLLLITLMSACSTSQVQKPGSLAENDSHVVCADYLRKWGLSHPKISYVTCKKEDPTIEQPRLIVTYNVDGKDAEAVEKHLMKTFEMKKLVFACCGWEPQGTFKDAKGRDAVFPFAGKGHYRDPQYVNEFTIAMLSGETTDRRKEKAEFKIIVETIYLGL